jgi:hypothetical protein
MPCKKHTTPEQQRQLILFLTASAATQATPTPEPRNLSSEQKAFWMAEDEADMGRSRPVAEGGEKLVFSPVEVGVIYLHGER